ncbi:NRDE protein-domain-containing protein [Mycena maculata]|uniref:NRDE protein-domain-containing protein n=1 Tax=Mycena maculata TaxID=230809 RepID=A0AAD7ICV5_9AGAR|nr:NRDE protein-domain-containing protein [Mycena maculata]
MCVAFWTLEHPDYALILCANRDEYLARPTRPAAFHSFGSTTDEDRSGRVLSGRDISAGGTWLGLAPSAGRVALLTNITEPPLQALPSSRGALVPTYLLAPPDTPLDALYPPTAQYAGFNLLLLGAQWASSPSAPDAPRLHFPHASLLTNNGAWGTVVARALRPEERVCSGVSNAAESVDGVPWPKVAEGRRLFQDAVAGDVAVDADAQDTALSTRLFALLRTTAAVPVRAREDLRQTICVSPLTVNAGGYYATRLATVLLVRRDGTGVFIERDVWRVGAGGEGLELTEPGEGERRFRIQELARSKSNIEEQRGATTDVSIFWVRGAPDIF